MTKTKLIIVFILVFFKPEYLIFYGVKKIRVQLYDSNVLELAQIQAYDTQGNNIAVGALVSMSSTSSGNNKCTDGIANSSCKTNTEVAWVEIDLGATFENILKIRIMNTKTASNQSKIEPARVRILDGGDNLVDNFLINTPGAYFTFETQLGKDIHLATLTCTEADPYKIRYVKVQSENVTSKALYVKQIEVLTALGVNLALGKEVTRSSDGDGMTELVTDGLGESVVSTGSVNLEEWFSVDLADGFSNIEKIKITLDDQNSANINPGYLYLFGKDNQLLEHIPIRSSDSVQEYFPSCQVLDIV